MNIKQTVLQTIGRFVGAVARRKKLIVLGAFALGALGAIPVFALGGHQLVEVVDSAAFCTNVCHDVHKAEAITYKVSPHSEVACAKCHVGAGTSNLINSKFRGMKDILPTFTNSYHKPILTPLDDLRPSTETCETCHWSQKFSGDVPVIKTSYKSDQANTRNTVALVLKLGGGSNQVASGVHWHATAKIWYLPVDDQRKEIAWVATQDSSGNVTEYVDPNRIGEITPELIAAKKRQMDCVDCHNRVTHLFRSPDELINNAITDGSIDIKLPYIKAQSLAVLDPQSKTLDEANAKIEAIRDFYKTNYPDVIATKKDSLDKAIAHLKEIAKLTTFDDGLDWNTHPDNAVHNKPDDYMLVDWQGLAKTDDSSGCFRCHGNLMKVESTGQLHIDDALNGQNIDQFVARVNRTLDDVAKAPPVMSVDNVTAMLKTLAATDNATIASLGESANHLLVSANSSVGFPSDNRTAAEIADNITALIPVGAYPKDFVLPAECESCHHTVKSNFISPLAPAVPHPVDGLDNCLGCHNPTSAKPFKTTHPWTTNEACNSCHESAPKLKALAVGVRPAEAKDIPHETKGLEECLVCHGPGDAQALKPEHPWATVETCSSCHSVAGTLKPVPLSTPPKTPGIAHPVKGYDDCLSCHGQPTIMPFATSHPWSTNNTCAACHKEGTLALDATHTAAYELGPKIAHSTTGIEECGACHRPSVGHPWTSSQLCTRCHQPFGAGGSGGAGGGGAGAASGAASVPPPSPAVAILHPIAGLENCLSCHDIGNARPFPTNHVGRPNTMCLICHKQAPLVTIPGAPSALGAAAVSAGQVSLTWTDNGAGATGHRIERATNNTFTANLVSVTGSMATGFTDTMTLGSTTYYYRAYSSNSAGESPASNTASVVTPAATGAVPAAPTSLVGAVISATQVNLTWLDNATTETGYRLDRSTDSGFAANLVTVNVAPNSVAYSDTTATGSTNYFYRVYAFNAVGNSGASNTCTASTPALTVDPAALYANNCVACHGANRQGGSASALTSAALAARTMSTVTSTITNGTAGMPAYSSTLSSAQISAIAQWLKGTAPAAPSGLAAVASGPGQVNLTWVDNSADETGFRVERATDNGFTLNFVTAAAAANAVSYSDTTVAGSTTYYYRVFATNAVGDSAASNTGSAGTPAATVAAPSAPTGLAASAINATQVNLNWLDNATTETGYRIDRATDGAFTANLVTVNAAANAAAYSDTTVSGSTTYFYRVYSFNSGGNSAASNAAAATTPAPVIDPAALYSANCASCHGANRQGGSASALTSAALSAVSLSQVNTIITSGTAGMPGFSASMNAAQISALAQWLKGSPPAAPSSLSGAAANAGQITVTWIDNSADETGFRVERATNNTFTAGFVTAAAAANAVSYTDAAVSGSITYYYRVYATNAAGDSTPSNTATVTTPAATVAAPAAPTTLAASAASATQVSLTWNDNANSETGYRIDRASDSAFATGLVTVNTAANAAAYTDATVSGSTTYYYRAYAFNAGGNSAASNTATATTPAATIDAAAIYATNCASCHGANRQGASASALTSSALSSVSLATVTSFINNGTGGMPGFSSSLSSAQISALAQWLKGAPPAPPSSLSATAANAGQVNLTWLDNSTDETGFRVERATNNTFTTNLLTAAVAANAVAYSDTTVAGSTAYYYRVYATNGAGDSGASNTATATTPVSTVAAPAAPTGLTASVISAIQANLSWIDNATTETGYRIERATNNSFTTSLVTVNVAANTNVYFDTTVSGSTTYYYRVYAFNSGGNSGVSNTATAVTPAPGPGQVFASNCASCHGANGQGTAAGPAIAGVAIPTTSFITRDGGVTMPAFNPAQISATDLTNLATYVAGLATSPTTGAAQYALNCAVCHGATGLGTSKAPDVAGVPSGTGTSVTRGGLGTVMPAYTSSHIGSTPMTNLANYIASLGPAPTSGWGVYAEYCAVCHGVGGQGGGGGPRIAGDSASTTSSATRSGPDNMPAYTTTQISDVALVNLSNYVRNLGTTVPAAASSVSAVATSGRVDIYWVNNAVNHTGVRVERSTTNTFSAVSFFSVASTAESYSDTGVVAGTTYYYRVFATNSVGSSSPSNTATVATP